LIHKAKTEELKTKVQHLQTGLTGESDRCATTQSGDFEAEDTRRDCKACVKAKQVAVAGHPSDGAMTKISEFALEGHVSLIS
jgi:ubiquitin